MRVVRGLYEGYELKLSRFTLNITNIKTPNPAQFQAIFPFHYGGSRKYASVAPTTNFQQKFICIVFKSATIQMNRGIFSVFTLYFYGFQFNSIKICQLSQPPQSTQESLILQYFQPCLVAIWLLSTQIILIYLELSHN